MLRSKVLKNNKGLASIEMIPVMVVIAILLNFSLGFFGVIQTGILNQIAARNYAFETFRHRTNLVYFRDFGSSPENYSGLNTRVHAIASDRRPASSSFSIATTRPIGFGMNPEVQGSSQDHNPLGATDNDGIFSIRERVRNEDISIAPVWIRPAYGICLNVQCEK